MKLHFTNSLTWHTTIIIGLFVDESKNAREFGITYGPHKLVFLEQILRKLLFTHMNCNVFSLILHNWQISICIVRWTSDHYQRSLQTSSVH